MNIVYDTLPASLSLPTLHLPSGATITPLNRNTYAIPIDGNLETEFYAAYPGGGITFDSNPGGEPANEDIDVNSSRNGIYVLILRQSTPEGTTSQEPAFGLSIQSRLAYYDN